MVGRTHSSRLNMLRILRHCRGTNLGIGEASFCDSPTAKIKESKNLFMKELRTTIIKKTFPRQVKKVKHTSSLPHFLSPRVGLKSNKTNDEVYRSTKLKVDRTCNHRHTWNSSPSINCVSSLTRDSLSPTNFTACSHSGAIALLRYKNHRAHSCKTMHVHFKCF